MNDAYWVQCCLMGDVLFRQDCTVGFTMTVSTGPTTYAYTLDLRAGSWFATPLVFWQYVVAQWNAAMPGGAGQASVTLETDPDLANYGKIAITPDDGWGTITSIGVSCTDTTVYPDIGLAATTYTTSGSSVFYLPVVLRCFLTPVWPAVSYERSGSNRTGNVARAHDGTVYSIVGTYQETVSLSLALDRRSQTYDEITDFLRIWRERWARGRAVTFYLDREDIETTSSATVDYGDVLLLSDAQTRIDFSRTIDYKEFQDKLSSVTFVVRTPLPANQINQAYYLLT